MIKIVKVKHSILIHQRKIQVRHLQLVLHLLQAVQQPEHYLHQQLTQQRNVQSLQKAQHRWLRRHS